MRRTYLGVALGGVVLATMMLAATSAPVFAQAQGKTAAQLLEEYEQRQRELAALGQGQNPPPRPPNPPGPPTPPVRPCPPGQMSLLGVCSQMGR